jgi:hypothetical protein
MRYLRGAACAVVAVIRDIALPLHVCMPKYGQNACQEVMDMKSLYRCLGVHEF